MTKKILLLSCLLIGVFANAQITSSDFKSKEFVLANDTIKLHTTSINSQKFNVYDANNTLIKPSNYQIDFLNAQLIINSTKYPIIRVDYFLFPDFVTKTYKELDEKIIVPNTNDTKKLYSLTTNKKPSEKKLLEGLSTKGHITRGVTVGNNQNSVVNANLDLNITGKLSKDVSIRANIFDTNIPLQDNGYSQNITDFDRIFIELTSKKWRVKAGDLDLVNTDSHFFPFTKKVSGLEVEASLSDETSVLASGAIVRGRFAEYKFNGKEGNQGPYRVFGTEQNSFIILVAESEILYANGIPLKRGENNDYTIDYNTAEIRFNTTYPVTNDLRFHLSYQYSDRSYNRFITYEKASYQGEKFGVTGIFYNENDAKNQPIQQPLTDDQKIILSNAGNDVSKMVSQSAYIDSYSDSKILYKKIVLGALETFEHSTNPDDELYNVSFTFVGVNKGDYLLEQTIAIGNVFRYAGANLGNYNPVTRLAAPTKLQVMVVNSSYKPINKTAISAEIAVSNNDNNLFSSIDDESNKGLAAKLNWEQVFIDKAWQFSTKVDYEYVQQNFNIEQRFVPVEFERNWNLFNPVGNRQMLTSSLILKNKKKSYINYNINHLSYSENYKGTQHQLTSKITSNKTNFYINGSLLNSNSPIEDNTFIKASATIEHQLSRKWIGGFINTERNEGKNKSTKQLNLLSHQFKEIEAYIGFGDSTKVFAKIGVNYRENDSVRNNNFTQVNNRKTFYINSKLIQNKNTDLSIFANYKSTENAFINNEQSLNSSVVYGQKLFNNFIHLNTQYETSSGNIPRQEYVYIKTEPGQGFYTWIDYNNNGIKEFNEFEIAQYQDQAEYLRMALQNVNYINTQRAKWTQSIIINPSQWASKTGVQKIVSHFYNQTYFVVDNEQQRINSDFNLNPFDFDETSLLGLNLSVRNSLFYNKNLQKYSITYTYGKSKNKHLYSIGNQEINNLLHQLELQHKMGTFWLIDLSALASENLVKTENFTNKNYQINTKELLSKFTFKYNKDHHFSLFYQFKDKKNVQLDFEQLRQQNVGSSYFFNRNLKQQIRAEINLFLNDFEGNMNSPVSYQMLEGLQSGRNYTWSLLFQQKVNSFLNFNINYLGRKSENSKTIHTGSVQFRANF